MSNFSKCVLKSDIKKENKKKYLNTKKKKINKKTHYKLEKFLIK